MRNLFPGYYRPTKEEFDLLWRECTFSFDANILLNIHRYSPKARERFFEILEAFNERVWITHQAAYEYQKNHLDLISKQAEPYTKLEKILNEQFEKLLDKLQEELQPYAKRHSFNAYVEEKQIIEPIKTLHEQLIKILSEASTVHSIQLPHPKP